MKVNEYEEVKYVNGFVCFFSKIKQQFSKKLMRLSKRRALKSQPIKSFEMSSSNMAVFPSFPSYLFRDWPPQAWASPYALVSMCV